MSTRSKSRTVRNILFQIAYYYSVILGVTSLRYDSKRRQLLQPTWLKIYTFVANVVALGSIPYSFNTGRNSMAVFGDNILIKYIHTISLVVGIALFVLSVLLRWGRERYLVAIIRELIAMECDYFDAVPVRRDIDGRFDRLFFVKFTTVLYQTVSLAFVIFNMAYDRMNFTNALIALAYINSMNITHCVMFHYFGALWHMSRAYAILNDRLLTIAQEVHRLQTPHCKDLTIQKTDQVQAVEVRTIARLHHRLADLVERLNLSYKSQMMLVLFANLLLHVTSGHYTFFIYGGKEADFQYSLPIITFGIFCTLLVLLDYYLVFVLCDIAVAEYESTSDILRSVLEFPQREDLLGRSCELFSMQLMRRKLRINVGGMFNLNKNTFFLLMGETVQQTFILVMFDYENRDKFEGILKSNE